jgi:hypothetical protein
MSDEGNGAIDVLMEAAAGAFRERDAWGRILPSPAWCDLGPTEREALFELQMESRAWERLVGPGGLSGTGREVVRRARGLGQIGEEGA